MDVGFLEPEESWWQSVVSVWNWRIKEQHGVQCYLGHGEAQLGQLGLSHQRDGDAVGKDQVSLDDVLNDVVTQTTEGGRTS